MNIRALAATGESVAREIEPDELHTDARWVWIDIELDPHTFDVDKIRQLTDRFDLDQLALHDAFADVDIPKVDDFDNHLLIVLHGLGNLDSATHEIDCFLTRTHLLTFRTQPSLSTEAMWTRLQQSPDLASGGPDELLARLSDVISRRLLAAIDSFDVRLDELVEPALNAAPTFLADHLAIRAELSDIRKVLHPQREVFDELRRNPSPVLSDSSRRRFADVFDVALRSAHSLEGVRSGLSETLDAYRGAEAKQATEVTKVLTIYAAIMLPLSLVVGFFGMNHPNLPTLESRNGWLWAAGLMLLISVGSLVTFIWFGWIRAPRRSSVTSGLVRISRTPVRLAGSLFQATGIPDRRRERPPTSLGD